MTDVNDYSDPCPVPEPEDDEGEDMEGEHIVHHVRDPAGDEAAHA